MISHNHVMEKGKYLSVTSNVKTQKAGKEFGN